MNVIEGKNKKKRYLFLFNDLCLLTKATAKGVYKYKRYIFLDDDTTVENILDTLSMFIYIIFNLYYYLALKNAFRLVSQKEETTFVWKNNEERETWLIEFQKLLKEPRQPRCKFQIC